MLVPPDRPRSSLRPRALPALLALLALLAGAADGAASTLEDGELRYVVQPGDTLIGIAERLTEFPRQWPRLQRHNRVGDPYRLVPGSVLRIPAAWLRPEATVAEVVWVHGPASVQAGDGPQRPLQVGDTLRAGERVRTGELAAVTLRFVDGARLLIAAHSRVALRELLVSPGTGAARTSVDVLEGDTQSRVPRRPEAPPSRYEMRTPTLTLGVRGTEFRTRVDADGQRARGEVLSGEVQAAAPTAAASPTPGPTRSRMPGPAPTLLGPGQGLVADQNGPGAPQSLLAAPDLSAVPARVERLPLRFTWPSQAGAVGWRAQVFAGGHEDRLLLDSRTPEPLVRFADLPDGPYELRVRSVAADGLEGTDTTLPFVLKARPEPPFTREPRPGVTLYGDQVTLAWARPSAVPTVRLQVAGDAGFDTPLVDRAGLDTESTTLGLPPGTYRWRVASVRADGDQGPWSDAETFTLKPVPPSPPLEPPQVGDDGIVLRWPAGTPGARYQLQLARDPAFADVILDRTLDRNEAVLDRPGAGTYHVRVRTIDPDGYAGPYGGASELRIPPSRWWLLAPVLMLWLGL